MRHCATVASRRGLPGRGNRVLASACQRHVAAAQADMRAFMAHTSGMLSTLQAQFMKLVASAALPPPSATGPGLPAGGLAASPTRTPCAAAAGSERSLGDAGGASDAPACASGAAAPACADGAAGRRGASAPAAREPLAERVAGAGVEAPELPRAGPRPAPYGGQRGPAAPAAAPAPGRWATRPAHAKENAGAVRSPAAAPGECGSRDGCTAWGVSAPSAGLRSPGVAWRDGVNIGAASTRATISPGAAQQASAAPPGRGQSRLEEPGCQQAHEEPRSRAPAGAAKPAVWSRVAAAAEADEHVWPCDALC